MEGMEGQSSGPVRYTLKPTRVKNEDILFCIDVDAESMAEMKATGPNGRPLTRLEAIRQAILLFINSKLSINPEHRFGFSVLSKSASLLRKEFSSEVEFAITVLRGLSATSSSGQADPSTGYSGWSSVRPQHQWPVKQKLFTLDVLYLHDKPGPDNCPQEVYDALVDTLELVCEYDGYICVCFYHTLSSGARKNISTYPSLL